jgi:hypothetical protein
MIGAIIGAVVVGLLCGLIPLALGRKRERLALGWVGFALCIPAGLLLGLIGALPMAGLMSLVIVMVGRPEKKPRHTGSGTAPKPRTPAPEPYDL